MAEPPSPSPGFIDGTVRDDVAVQNSAKDLSEIVGEAKSEEVESAVEAGEAGELSVTDDASTKQTPSETEKKSKRLTGRLGTRNEDGADADDAAPGEIQRRSDAFKVLDPSKTQFSVVLVSHIFL